MGITNILRMIKYKLIILVWLSLITGSVFAQNNQNFQKQYLNAKVFFREAKYNLAMEAFKPLIALDDENPFSAYASYYYALSAYRQGYPPMARDMFLQIRRVFPKWSKLDDVNLWLGTIYLETESYDLAFKAFNQVKNKSLKPQISDTKYYFLNQIKDLDKLKELYSTNAEEKELGEILARKIAGQTLAGQDRELLNDLIGKFNFDEDQFNIVSPTETIFKDTYRVAVLLPFMANELEPDHRRQVVNQNVLDLYLGIRLAVDTLEAQGIDIELLAYDTKRDTTVTRRILEKTELKGVDLIIGPLFSHLLGMVNEFSFKNKINIINPVHSSSGMLDGNPYSFLYSSSDAVVGKKAAEYILKKVPRKPGIVFYGDAPGDSALAFAYKQRMEEAQFEIIHTRKVDKNDTRSIQDVLLVANSRLKEAATADARKRYKIGLDSLSHIFVASDNNLISSKVLSTVRTRGDGITVIGSSNWLDLSVINYESYFNLGTVLYAPGYCAKDTEAYNAFRSSYIQRHRKNPSKLAEKGYDLMLLMGNSLHKYGKYFQTAWNEMNYLPGYLTMGYNYQNTNYNQLVPMLNFSKEGLKLVYQNDDN